MSVACRKITKESLLPNHHLKTTVNGELGGEKKTKDVFILSHPDVLALMRYVWTGRYLPTKREDYITQVGIDKEGLSNETVSNGINTIVKAYANIKEDNQHFNDVTWRSLVDLAGQVRKYAEKAGGSYDSSYYAGLVEAIRDYNNENDKSGKSQDKAKMRDAKKTVHEITNTMLKRVTELLNATKKAEDDVATFKNLTKNHGVVLKNANEHVHQVFLGEHGEIERLQKDIKKLQNDLADEQREYDHDVVVAATTPTYAWVTIFGLIAAIATASDYGHRATVMLNTMNETQRKINTDNAQLKAARTIAADCQRMTSSTSGITDLIDAATQTLSKMQTAWQFMKDDLSSLLESVKEDNGENIPGPIMEKRHINGMIESWNALGKIAKNFEDNAFISEPEALTLSQFIAKYGKKK